MSTKSATQHSTSTDILAACFQLPSGYGAGSSTVITIFLSQIEFSFTPVYTTFQWEDFLEVRWS